MIACVVCAPGVHHAKSSSTAWGLLSWNKDDSGEGYCKWAHGMIHACSGASNGTFYPRTWHPNLINEYCEVTVSSWWPLMCGCNNMWHLERFWREGSHAMPFLSQWYMWLGRSWRSHRVVQSAWGHHSGWPIPRPHPGEIVTYTRIHAMHTHAHTHAHTSLWRTQCLTYLFL